MRPFCTSGMGARSIGTALPNLVNGLIRFEQRGPTPQKFETCPRWGARQTPLLNVRLTGDPSLTFELPVAMQLKTLRPVRCPDVCDERDCGLGRGVQATYGDSIRNRRPDRHHLAVAGCHLLLRSRLGFDKPCLKTRCPRLAINGYFFLPRKAHQICCKHFGSP